MKTSFVKTAGRIFAFSAPLRIPARIGTLSTLSLALLLSACQTTRPPQPDSKPPLPNQATQTTPPVTTPATGTLPAANQGSTIPGKTGAAELKQVSFAALPGWDKDDLREAWPAFLASCSVLGRRAEWKEACTVAKDVDATNNSAVRVYFESFFLPYQAQDKEGNDTGLITGYYEPLLRGSRKRGGVYQVPLHRVPEDLVTVELGNVYPELKNMRLRGKLVGNKLLAYGSRAELENSNALLGKEIVWVDDAVDAFFVQVQGSGRVQLDGGRETVRLAYADQNGHPYKSIGRYLVDKGELKLEQASMQGIRGWLQANPQRANELFHANPSYVFFREEKITDPKIGPKGALGVPLSGQRSIAIDPTMLPLGAPMFLATTMPNSDQILQRLMLAQDTGGAIRGAVRADFFWGFGNEAGEKAGKMKQKGQMWVLLPRAS